MAAALLAALSFVSVARGAEASWSFDTPSWDYGLVKPDSAPVTHTFVLTNTGEENLSVWSVSVSGNGGFRFGAIGCGFIAPGASCGIEIIFDPEFVVQSTGELEVFDLNGLAEPAVAKLSGTGDGPRLTGDLAGATFSSVPVGSVSAPKTLAFTNEGTRGLTISSVSLAATDPRADPGQFRLLGGTCAPGVVVAPTQSCTIDVAMAPTRLDFSEATLLISSDAPDSPYQSWISGIGSPPIEPPRPSPPPRPPTATIARGPAKNAVSRRAAFWLSGSPGTAGFACKLDGGEFTGCKSPVRYRDLRRGQHRFAVRAIDSLGQVGPPVAYRWWIRRS